MHIHTRRLIAFIFILIFLICAPILILYTAGYRYNLKKEQVQKTGALVLETKPTGATIILNKNRLEEKTPARLNNILPDEYLITLSAENHYTWQKNLEVKVQETTFAEDVTLFKKTAPVKMNVEKINWLSFSPQNRFAVFTIATTTGENVYLQNLSNPSQQDVLFSEKEGLGDFKTTWTKNGSLVLLTYNDKALIVSNSILIRRNFDISNLVKTNKLENFHWGEDSDSLFAQAGNTVYQVDVSANKLIKLYELPKTNSLIDFLIYNNGLYIIQQLGQKIYITKTNVSGDNSGTLLKSIELKNAQQAFDTVFDNYIGIRDLTNNTYYLVNTEIDKIAFYKENVNNLDLHTKTDYLLFSTEQDVSYLNLKDEALQEKNITRFSQGMKLVRWHKSPNYSLFLQNNKLSIIELDERNGHWILNLPGENITDFQIDAKSKNIYYLQDGYLWRLQITE
jgi:hypothetical protein